MPYRETVMSEDGRAPIHEVDRPEPDNSGEVTIRIRNLGKEYRIGALEESRYETLRDRITDGLKSPFRRLWRLLKGDPLGAADLDESFWALRDISFDVRKGEVVGIIGKNGAGKTTLLKLLSRITEPTTGWAELKGRVSSLLEVGMGFHPELTGRDNVYLNGAILGMTRTEISEKFDDIVDFAEIRKFIDTPVKHYSTGMYVRLAFAVAAHLEPEILLVDEVLAVGDAAFQRKCLGRMDEVAREGRTVLFISHNMGSISRLCERVIWLEEGRIRREGDPREIVAAYLASDSELAGEKVWEGGYSERDVDEFQLDRIRLLDGAGNPVAQVHGSDPFHIAIDYRVFEPLPAARVGVLVRTPDGVTVFDAYDVDNEAIDQKRTPGVYTARCTVPGRLLSPGRYLISVNAGVPGSKNLAFVESPVGIEITESGAVGVHAPGGRDGVLRPDLQWEQRESAESVV